MDNRAFPNQSINAICRICFEYVENGKALFSEQEESKELLDKIYLCFQIILNYEDYLPSLICCACTEELTMANNFRLKCVTFEDKFTTFCKQSACKQVEETVYKKQNHNYNETELFDEHGPEESDPIINDVDNKKTDSVIANIDLKCNICEKVLKTKASLLKHTISMHEKRKHVGTVTGTGVNRRYHCTKCSYVTPHSQTLVNHMRRHDGERPYHCECGKRFTQSSSLAAHQKTHSSNTYYTCSTCGKQFKHAFTLKNHLRVHNTGLFSCNICKKNLKSRQSLQEHMRRHYNIRNFNCEDCGATFVACSDLLNHRKKHSTEKKAECHLCGYRTHTKKNLIIHLKRYSFVILIRYLNLNVQSSLGGLLVLVAYILKTLLRWIKTLLQTPTLFAMMLPTLFYTISGMLGRNH